MYRQGVEKSKTEDCVSISCKETLRVLTLLDFDISKQRFDFRRVLLFTGIIK